MTSVPGSTRSGTPLNMYSAGNSKSFALCASFSNGRKKSYVAFFSSTLVNGNPVWRSTIGTSVGIGIAPFYWSAARAHGVERPATTVGHASGPHAGDECDQSLVHLVGGAEVAGAVAGQDGGEAVPVGELGERLGLGSP